MSCKSNHGNKLAPYKHANDALVLTKEYVSTMVCLFKVWLVTHRCNSLFFFYANKIGAL